jgi:hypothetical protein
LHQFLLRLAKISPILALALINIDYQSLSRNPPSYPLLASLALARQKEARSVAEPRSGFDSAHFRADKASRLYFQHCEELEKALANSSFLLKWPTKVDAESGPKRGMHQVNRQ